MNCLCITVNSSSVTISLNIFLFCYGKNKVTTCQYSLVHLYKGRKQWKKQPFPVIMVHELAYACKVVTANCTVAQGIRCQLHTVEAWIQFQDSLREICPRLALRQLFQS
jgi:hypothetical protein